MDLIRFDYVSDLHIDYWDKKYWSGSSRGKKHFPLDWEKQKRNDILVVAGDVSDRIDTTVDYLNSLRKWYSIILFIDGNHEHYEHLPELCDSKIFHDKLKDGIYYLKDKDYVIGKTVFIGTCGWWDYGRCSNPEDVDLTINSRKSYIRIYGKNKNSKMAENLIGQSKKDYRYLMDKIIKYARLKEIDDIVIVTHTVPKKEFARVPATDFNSYFSQFSTDWLRSMKVSRWVFGHNHESFEKKIPPLPPLHKRVPVQLSKNHNTFLERDFYYLSNPRGRPGDWDREEYTIKTSGTIPVCEACRL